jgi:hypothetical protein
MKPKDNLKLVDLQTHSKKLRQDLKDVKNKISKIKTSDGTKSKFQGMEKRLNAEITAVEKEYKKISTRFTSTHNTKIHRISRIQNRYLYNHFEFERKRIQKNNKNGKANVKELFHGTRGTDPKAIYYGTTGCGFDARLGGGFYGRGAYFAEKASYSNGYCHNSNGHKYMFLAHVACGNVKDYGTTLMNSLKRAPDLPPGHPDYGNATVPGLYDSVKGGPHSGSCMYIIYTLSQAYPAYLIEYA